MKMLKYSAAISWYDFQNTLLEYRVPEDQLVFLWLQILSQELC